MVTSSTSLTGSGLRDWLMQRISAIILGVYTLFVVIYLMVHAPLQYGAWHHLFMSPWMRAFTVIALLSLLYHTWIGLWTVFTDYIKIPFLRLFLQIVVVMILLGYVVWGINIVWGF